MLFEFDGRDLVKEGLNCTFLYACSLKDWDGCRLITALNHVKLSAESGSAQSVSGQIDDAWQLNQTYAETLLFGQYVAEIFYRITGR